LSSQPGLGQYFSYYPKLGKRDYANLVSIKPYWNPDHQSLAMSAKKYADVEKYWQDPDKSPFSLGPFTGLCLARDLKDYPAYIQHIREYLNYLKYEYERNLNN